MRQLISLALIALIATLGCASPGTALSITPPPPQAAAGDTIAIEFSDLPDNAVFTLQIGSRFEVEPGEAFSFEANSLVLPISLNSGTISASTENTAWTGLAASMGTTSVSIAGDADPDGRFSAEEALDIPEGTYEHLKLEGEAADTAEAVTAKLQLAGTKQGADDGRISFIIGGIGAGEVTVTVLVDGVEQMRSRVAVVNETAPDGAQPTSRSSGNTADNSSWQSPGISSESSGQEGGKHLTITSPDGRVSLTGVTDENLAIVETEITNAPEDWVAIGTGYTIIPPETGFSPAATLTIELPGTVLENLSQYNLFIARYEDDAWRMTQSRIDGNTIAGMIDAAGTYGLMTLEQEMNAAPTATLAQPPAPVTPAPTTHLPPGYAWYTAAAILTGFVLLLAYLRRRY
ncbi:hypothetical protein FGU65_10610 [Methanoculleus sp. FWC-SCC1]|uniref:PGF-pre-PGF domain-containing protein n=1 Tax=Methanoculleus frigidifontis TaxID=2584085 RepID=A0ABT8MBM2_9EURY|nr:hypothetical protein [Methanoculleus sp. FWC-SCC1]MDN7025338.1 hypothetical protein [Methanoculleus sp. FWC-SCC1]